ncbi:MAG: DUF2891 domain-containing protein [Nocardioidaceae bacterium]|nr:DUF2891 domain-containing protein [Nocardioidaceae bacterium]MCL2612755.1 DUF2891 domain-containing protein [Nocardioidaceae bacterium]
MADADAGYAAAWAATVLRVLRTPYPWISGHVSTGPGDCDVTPERLHPAFHGSVDWHSSAHMQWSGVRLLGEAGDHLEAETRDGLVAELDGRLTLANGEVEAAYLRARPGFERPYGWAWAAMLAAAVRGSALPEARRWREATALVADAAATNLLDWLPRLTYPVRHGVHSNTAFALLLCHEAYDALGRRDVVELVERRALEWYADERDHPVAWEPSGEDFLSPALCTAALMRRVLEPGAFGDWLAMYLPRLGHAGDPLLVVPAVGDPSDGKGAHLLGLALSRAWQLRLLAPYVDEAAARRIAGATAEQVASVEGQIVGGDIMATHWLVSFALLAADAEHPG